MKILASLVVSLLTATLLSVGLSAPAQSAPPYGPDVTTSCSTFAKKNPMRAGNRNTVVVRWRTEFGRTPTSRVRYSIVKRKNGRVVSSGVTTDSDGRVAFRTAQIPRGRYRISAAVNPSPDRYTTGRCASGLRAKR